MKTLRFVFSAVVVAFALAGESGAQAQPVQKSPASGSALDDKARELFRDGVKAAEASQWAKAHASFLAAWSLKEHYQIAGNLGTSEAKLGKWRDAATHLSYYLREAPKEKVAERKSAEDLLAQARAKVGSITVRAEPAGAEVFVDGVSVGKAPLAGEVFVEPGAHGIEVKLEGYEPAKKNVSAGAGSAQSVEMRLAQVGPKESGKPLKEAAQGEASKPPPTGSVESRGPNKALIIAGAATSAALIGTGIVLAVVSNGKAGEADEKAASLRQATGRDDFCVNGQAAGCEELRGLVSAQESFANGAFWTLLLGGAAGAGTTIYALVGGKAEAKGALRFSPIATHTAGGLLVDGKW
ncbi:MAG: PEGA domain-containing protein [Polyangiaceae bacterium]|nr:PEGA domain-containing protein [Polyangiaceae bacterium]NUQ75046.1 PEGA domain-containing protein [Polyangiaceae bacterium]